MRRKRRGSSLITVVIIFTILITVGTALLSMTVGDYKMRIKESRKIENLYSADSGLDVGYDIIIKTFDEAVKFADFNARQLKIKAEKFSQKSGFGPNVELYKKAKKDLEYAIENISKEHKNCKGKCSCNKKIKQLQKNFDEESEKLTNLEFERCFKIFVKRDSDEVGNDEVIPNNILGESICKNKYKNMSLEDKNIEKELINEYDFSKFNEVKFKSENSKPELFVCSDDKLDELKKINENDDEFNNIKNNFDGINYYEDNNKYFNIKITSRFIDKDKSSNSTKNNLRILQSNYIIKVPRYDQVTFKENSMIINPNIIKQNQILVGSDMNIYGDNSVNKTKLEIYGDIFVQGNKQYIENKVYDKYKGGIDINNSDVDFLGNVSTSSTFLIQDNSNVNIKENLYALNIYLGKLEQFKYANEFGGKSNLNIKNGSVLIDNDLALKAFNANIIIKDFYGLNDKNIKGNEKQGELERTSSSIIVNGNKESNIRIIDSAYIMGVAHINGDSTEYTTGESTAIKGNYIAYAMEKNDPYNIENYIQDNLNNKIECFNEYWKNKLEIINTGGIELPENNVHAVGAIAYKDKENNPHINKGTYNMIDDNIINQKRLEYANRVYNLNQLELNKDENYLKKSYESNTNNKNPIYNLMKLYNIPPTYKLSDQKTKEYKAIFNNDDNKNIFIRGMGADKTDDNLYEIDARDGILNTVIATSGDVIVDGEVEINGNLIIEGDLIIKGNGKKIIKYDQSIVNKLYEENLELFNNVFQDKDNEIVEEEVLNVEYDLNKFLKKNLWRVVM